MQYALTVKFLRFCLMMCGNAVAIFFSCSYFFQFFGGISCVHVECKELLHTSKVEQQ